MQKKNFIRSN